MAIRILPPAIANQIAAGEVVERPASVVKELLENAVDAGSSVIDILIEQGGSRLIEVRDNGAGIQKSDLLLAARPHATSKISQIEDLFQIDSLGFRGEALASIGSVSRMSIVSRSKDSSSAWKTDVDFSGHSTDLVPAAHEVGTTVSVRDLFFAHPARKKFLRSDNTEFAHIEAMVKRVALSIPHIRVRLKHNGKSVLDVLPSHSFAEQQRRVAKILGGSFMDSSKYFSRERVELRLAGWISVREEGWPNTQRQHFYLNGRWIRDRAVMHGIRQALSQLITVDTQPAYVLYLEIPSKEFDVNVHPTKQEVRFGEPRLVHDFIYSSLVSGIAQGVQPEIAQIRLQKEDARDNISVQPSQSSQGAYRKFKLGSATNVGGQYQVRQQLRAYEVLAASNERQEKSTGKLQLGDPIAQLFDHYLITQHQSSWHLIHVPRARLALAQEAFNRDQKESQPLLIPETLQIASQHHQSMAAWVAQLESYGFSIGALSESQWVMRRIPIVLRYFDPSAITSVIINLVEEREHIDKQRFVSCLKAEHVALCQLTTEEKLQLLASCQHYVARYSAENWPDFVVPIAEEWLATRFVAS